MINRLIFGGPVGKRAEFDVGDVVAFGFEPRLARGLFVELSMITRRFARIALVEAHRHAASAD